MTLLCTFHNVKIIDSDIKKKPEVILDYNKTEAGVDTIDQVTGPYIMKRITRGCPLTILCNVIGISKMTAFIVWSFHNRSCDK